MEVIALTHKPQQASHAVSSVRRVHGISNFIKLSPRGLLSMHPNATVRLAPKRTEDASIMYDCGRTAIVAVVFGGRKCAKPQMPAYVDGHTLANTNTPHTYGAMKSEKRVRDRVRANSAPHPVDNAAVVVACAHIVIISRRTRASGAGKCSCVLVRICDHVSPFTCII